ncbi:hypothetical protein T492DRAFT_859869, partial [Pavlovales sp. CCMP2436]
MSQIRGAAQSERELAVRMANPSIDTYGTGTNPGESSYAALRPGRDANDPNSYTGNMAFGSYQRDSHAAQDMRNFYDTMDAVAARPDVAGGTPRKMDAIQELSQFSLDKAIIKHLGHNGNPRLAQLQYMMDQGQLDYMPQTVVVDNTPYTRGPLSLFQLAAGAQTSLNAESVPRSHPKRPATINRRAPTTQLAGDEVHTITNIRNRPADRDRAGLAIGAPTVRLLPWDAGRFDPLAGLPTMQEQPAPTPAVERLLLTLPPAEKNRVLPPRGMTMGIEPPGVMYYGALGGAAWDPAADVAVHLARGASVPSASGTAIDRRTAERLALPRLAPGGDSNSLAPDVFTAVPSRMRAGLELELLAKHADERDAIAATGHVKSAPGAEASYAPGHDGAEQPQNVSDVPLELEGDVLMRAAAVDSEMHAAVLGARPSSEVGDAARVVAATRRARTHNVATGPKATSKAAKGVKAAKVDKADKQASGRKPCACKGGLPCGDCGNLNVSGQDMLLLDNATSYFQNVGYTRTSNFQFKLKELDPQNVPKFGATTTFKVQKQDHLLGNLDLRMRVKLPDASAIGD